MQNTTREGGKMIATVPEKYTCKNVSMPRSITSERQYDLYAKTLFALESKAHMTREEGIYAKVLSVLIEEYDKEHSAIRDASPIEVLETLMDANDLSQKDLAPLFGSESIVSEVLNGKRPFAKNHIEKLCKRFHLSPAAFFQI